MTVLVTRIIQRDRGYVAHYEDWLRALSREVTTVVWSRPILKATTRPDKAGGFAETGDEGKPLPVLDESPAVRVAESIDTDVRNLQIMARRERERSVKAT